VKGPERREGEESMARGGTVRGGREQKGRESRDRGERARLRYLFLASEFLVTPLQWLVMVEVVR